MYEYCPSLLQKLAVGIFKLNVNQTETTYRMIKNRHNIPLCNFLSCLETCPPIEVISTRNVGGRLASSCKDSGYIK